MSRSFAKVQSSDEQRTLHS